MIVALTGGIGSGKSFVCRFLETKGIRVYDCDAAAKRLMRTSLLLQQQLCQLVGPELFAERKLQKALLARFLLASEENKQAVNAVIHPAVAADFLSSGYEWFESAILFESGFNKRVPCDFVVGVTAPVEVRARRVMDRDGISYEKAKDWIMRQMPEEEMKSRCNYIIVNDGETNIESEVDAVIAQLHQ